MDTQVFKFFIILLMFFFNFGCSKKQKSEIDENNIEVKKDTIDYVSIDNIVESKDTSYTNYKQNFLPPWVREIMDTKNIKIESPWHINNYTPLFIILDINGDNIKEIAFFENNYLLIIFKNRDIVKLNKLKDIEGEEWDIIGEKSNTYWYIDDNKDLRDYLFALYGKNNIKIKGDVINITDEEEGSIYIFYDGKDYLCQLTD